LDPRSTLHQSIIRYILGCPNHELAELDLSRLAAVFSIPPAILGERFEALANMSLEAFIDQEKIQRALRAIDESDTVDCGELAISSGFRDLECFRKTFKKLLLVDPETYIDLKRHKIQGKERVVDMQVRIPSKRRCIYA